MTETVNGFNSANDAEQIQAEYAHACAGFAQAQAFVSVQTGVNPVDVEVTRHLMQMHLETLVALLAVRGGIDLTEFKAHVAATVRQKIEELKSSGPRIIAPNA